MSVRATRRRRGMRAAAVLLVAGLAATGCTPASSVLAGTTVTVALADPFTSANPHTAYGSASDTNLSVAAATGGTFNDYDADLELVTDPSFGSYERVSHDPLVVTYTIAPGVRWSDGVPVDAADLLLAWAANSGSLNDPDTDSAALLDPETGGPRPDAPADVVYFDGNPETGLDAASQVPVPGADGRSITVAFDRYIADWPLLLEVGVPAHIVARKALGVEAAQEGKDALTAAIRDRNREQLAAVSAFWNTGFNFTETPEDPDLLVSSGPYTIASVEEGGVTLTANPEYAGEHEPTIETVVVRNLTEPLAVVAALAAGDVDVAAPGATAESLAALQDTDGVRVIRGTTGTWERLDLKFGPSRSGHFVDQPVREAFLKTVPRQQLVDELLRPLHPDAEVRSSHVFIPGSAAYERTVAGNGSAEFATPDIAAATRLLAEAGVNAPEVCIMFDPGNPRRTQEFALIQASAAQAGFRVTDCSSPDWLGLLGTPGSYDAVLYGLRETNTSTASVWAAYASASTVNNYSRYASDRVDALLGRLATPVDTAEREQILAEIDAVLWADRTGLPLFQYPTITAVSDAVSDVRRPSLAPTALWRPWEWRPAGDP